MKEIKNIKDVRIEDTIVSKVDKSSYEVTTVLDSSVQAKRLDGKNPSMATIPEHILIEDFIISRREGKIDMVNHPSHYTNHPSGIECIEITRYYNFSIGNAIKYLWRAGLKKEQGMSDKEKEIEDLKKAIFYINDRIKELGG